MERFFKNIISILIFVLLIACAIYGWFWYQFYHEPLIHNDRAETIKIPPNTGIVDLRDNLERRGLLRHPHFFLYMTRRLGHATRLRYGEYWIKPGMSAADLVENIVEGQGYVRHHVTLIEGWTFQKIKKTLAADASLIHKLKNKTNQQIMFWLGSKKRHPEGLFFPSTYYFLWGNSDLYILKKAYQKMQNYLQQQWRKRAKHLPYRNKYQALIVASMVEKETAVASERPIIAGVILHRLKIRMKLQVDPTVLYGVGKPFGSVITKRDLRRKTPYNTYQIYGLPPTPIDMPSASSILAALHPKKTKYLYYVARGDGSHQFSKTYKEHLAAIRKYRREIENEPEEEVLLQKLENHQFDHDILKAAEFVVHVIYL